MSIRVRNWRDQAPYVGHISALVWTLYQSHDKDETSPSAVNRLHGINSFVKHGLQGHQHSDHHQHDSIEQLYFVLRGRGQLTIGDDKVDVRDGTAVYMPVNVPHQAFNDGEGWMEHLIVSCPLDEIREGTPSVRDWRDVHPVVLENGTVSWPLLRREDEAPASDGGVLQRIHSVTRYAVQGRQGSASEQLDGIELVHYVLSGYGTIEDPDGNRQLVTEGSAAHVLPGVEHRFINQGEGWLEYVTFAVEVGEVEMPDESDADTDTEVVDEQTGTEEGAAASVLAEVDWDDADAVEAEEEIEEAVAADVNDEDEEAAEIAEDSEGEEDELGEIEEEVEDGDEGEEEDEVEEDGDGDGDGDDEDDDGDGDDEDDDGDGDDEDDDGEGDHEDDVDDEEDGEEEEEDEEADGEEEDGETDVDEDVDEDGDEEEDEEEEVEQEAEVEAEVEAEGDQEEFDLEDDDADFDIEDEDETTVEDETGEEDDDSPDPDRR